MTEEGQAFANSIGALFAESSAMENVNVQEGFALLAKEIMTRKLLRPTDKKTATNNKMRAAKRLTDKVDKENKKGGCC